MLLKLFTNCKITSGSSRSIISDLQRESFFFIPNSLAELFDENQTIDVDKILNQLDSEDQNTFNEYIDFLKENDLVFELNKSDITLYPDIDSNFHYPAEISNAIIDFDKSSDYSINEVLHKILIPSNCRHLQIRCYDYLTDEEIVKIISPLEKSFVKSIDLIIKNSPELNSEELKNLTKEYKKLRTLTLHSSKENYILQKENKYGFGVIFSIAQNINSSSHCGIIQIEYFNVHMQNYFESIGFNSCLNRKISIDVNGDIKNCPSFSRKFGNIKNSTLEQVLDHKEFKKYWKINKDQIKVCQDCEFRYICTDCRAFIENPDDIFSKPLKCGYNPYTNNWEEWSTNPLKQKAIDHYGIRDIL